MTKVLFLLFALIAIYLAFITHACQAKTQYPLSGEIELHPDWKPIIYLVQARHFNEIAADYLGQIVDSAVIAPDGYFFFERLSFPDEKILTALVVQKHTSPFANHLSDEIPSEANYMPIVLTRNQPLLIKAQMANFQKTCVTDSPMLDNQVISVLRDIRLEAYDQLRSSVNEDTHDDSLLLEREDSYNRYTKVLRNFADSTRSLEAALIAIRWVSPSGDFERTPEFLHGQCQKWSEIQPKHPFIQELCAVADRKVLPVLVGDVIPNAALPLVTGDTMMLIELLGKRLTIVDIWASWCAPCRKENRIVLGPLWSAYEDKGLQIIGYSLDGNASAWKAAIVKDDALWTNASHLSGDVTPFLERLRITTIPANFILDEKGMIVAKNIFGQELTQLVRAKLD